jgi:biotin carboxylase
MKLLALEASQNGSYYSSRYQQVEDFGGEVFVLNGLGEADFWPESRYRIVGSKQIDEIISAARAWHEEVSFDGVLTFSESAVIAVAAVAQALGLPGVGVENALTSRNKLLMRQAHEKEGAPHPAFRFATGLADALAAATEIGYPVIIKPTLGAASNFVFRIDSADEMRVRVPQLLAGMRRMAWFVMEAEGIDHGPEGLLVESFLAGSEHLIEALVWDDEVYLGSVVDRVTVEGDTFDDDVHSAPTSLTPEQLAAVHRSVTAGVHAQGIRRGALHAEVRFHDGEPYLLEIAVRPGGGGLDYIARITAGYCPIRGVMDVARGVRPDVRHYTPTGVHIAGMCLLCGAGQVERISFPEDLPSADGVFFFKITAKPGDIILRPPDGNNILGFLGMKGPSFTDAMEAAEKIADQIHVELSNPEGDL